NSLQRTSALSSQIARQHPGILVDVFPACIRAFVIPTEGRKLLVAGVVALQATADSRRATPFRNDKNVGGVPGRQVYLTLRSNAGT
ncbi:MAG TPA: hypothetical protein VJP02_32100, partial [Candidatus Sulfotelmatobacter sp.]|nr:hypothetical protein [Candidatus Sulfotelmatobacter sp.]